MPKFMSGTGGYNLLGRYSADLATAGTTIVAARTITAGFLASFRWAPATAGTICYLRRVTARFMLTTAYTTAQETGCDLIVARAYTVGTTGGALIDTGTTLTGSGKRFTAQPIAQLPVIRVGTTGALTGGTHTLDASPIGVMSGWSSAIGVQVPEAAAVSHPGGSKGGTLWDSRKTSDHIELATSEGFIIRNLVLQGAAGVGNWYFHLEWDEGTPSGKPARDADVFID